MNEPKIGVLQAIWRFFSFAWLRKALAINRAAEKQFTSSPQGISDAFTIHGEELKNRYKALRDAVARVQMVIETDTTCLNDFNREEEGLIKMRDGALQKFESAGTEEEKAKHQAAFERFDARINQIEAEQAALDKRIKETRGSIDAHLRELTKLQNRIKELSREEAQAIAEHISAKTLIQLNDQLQGLSSSVDRGPIEAVLKANRELTAKANISKTLAGTDVEQQDEAYAEEGAMTSSRDRMQAMLATRKAEREARTGTSKTLTPEKKTERPSI